MRNATSSSHRYDFMVFIGRFRFFHDGHLKVIRHALAYGRHVIIFVGSSKQPRSLRNPLTFEEVRQTILGALDATEQRRVSIVPLVDKYNELEWTTDVQAAVHAIVGQFHTSAQGKTPRICLIGHAKDRSNYYLRRFPQWTSETVANDRGLNATAIREDYFADADAGLEKWSQALPENVATFMRGFAKTRAFADLVEEAAFVAEYKRKWAAAPYAPTFVTTDAVLLQSGHILLVERRNNPGKGLLALPGGFLDQHERIKDAMFRELREETNLNVAGAILEGSIKAVQVFDFPYRSVRGRTVTHAFVIVLPDDESGLPKVHGGDDARRAFWMPIGELESEQLFEDHWQIIQTMLSYASTD